jgi:hypothetical protein
LASIDTKAAGHLNVEKKFSEKHFFCCNEIKIPKNVSKNRLFAVPNVSDILMKTSNIWMVILSNGSMWVMGSVKPSSKYFAHSFLSETANEE